MTTYTLHCDHPGCRQTYRLLRAASATETMTTAEQLGWQTSPSGAKQDDRCPAHALQLPQNRAIRAQGATNGHSEP